MIVSQPSNIELHLLLLVGRIIARLLLHLILVLLVLQERQHLSMLSLEALHILEIALSILTHRILLHLYLFEFFFCALPLRR